MIKRNCIGLLIFFLTSGCMGQPLLDEYKDPLFRAVQQGDTTTVVSFIQNNSCLTNVDSNGNTILHVAAFYGHKDIVSILSKPREYTNIFVRFWYWLTRKALPSIDAQNKAGDTALHEAVKKGHIQVVDVLLAHQAKKDIRNKYELTPFLIAIQQGNVPTIALFIKYGIKTANHKIEGKNVLIFAIENNQLNIIDKFARVSRLLNEYDDAGKAAIHYCVQLKNKDALLAILKQVGSVDYPDQKGKTALIYAVNEENEEFIPLLLSAGAHINKGDEQGYTPLHYAAAKNAVKNGAYLIEHGAQINSPSLSLDTPLHCATAYGSYDFVHFLLQKNVAVNSKNKQGETSFFIAVRNANKELVALLAPYSDINMTDNHKITPIMKAASEKNTDMVYYLLELGVDVLAKDLEGETVLHKAVKAGDEKSLHLLIQNNSALLNCVNNNGNTALHYASRANNIICTDALLQYGASLLSNKNGHTPLHLAIIYKASMHLLKLLLENGASYDLCDYQGNNCLTLSIIHENVYATDYFLSYPYLINQKNYEGFAPLHLAVKKEDMSLVRKILYTGYADINIKTTADGFSPLAIACSNGNINIVEDLLSHRADFDIKDHKGFTPLTRAIFYDKVECVKKLHKYGASPFKQNDNGDTALHIAAYNCSLNVIQFYLQHAQYDQLLDSCNYQKMTPLLVAVSAGHIKAVKLLLQDSDYINGHIQSALSVAKDYSMKSFLKQCISARESDCQAIYDLQNEIDRLVKENKQQCNVLNKEAEKGYAAYMYKYIPSSYKEFCLSLSSINNLEKVEREKLQAMMVRYHATELREKVEINNRLHTILKLQEQKIREEKERKEKEEQQRLTEKIRRKLYEKQQEIKNLIRKNKVSSSLLNQTAIKEYAQYSYKYTASDYESYSLLSEQEIMQLDESEFDQLRSELLRYYEIEVKAERDIQYLLDIIKQLQFAKEVQAAKDHAAETAQKIEQEREKEKLQQLQQQQQQAKENIEKPQQTNIINNNIPQASAPEQKHRKCLICYERNADVQAIPCKTCYVNKQGICKDCLKDNCARRGNVCPLCNLPNLVIP